jgi:hypothetical protein
MLKYVRNRAQLNLGKQCGRLFLAGEVVERAVYRISPSTESRPRQDPGPEKGIPPVRSPSTRLALAQTPSLTLRADFLSITRLFSRQQRRASRGRTRISIRGY